MVAVAAMAIMASCSKDVNPELGGAETPQQDPTASAYVKFSIQTPSATTRADGADGGVDEGTADESNIYSAALMAFDKNYDFIGVYSIKNIANKTFKATVAPSAYRFFLIANPNDEIWNELDKMNGFNQEQFASLPAIAMPVSSVTSTEKGFTMVNSGSKKKNSTAILVESLASVDESLDKISTDVNNPTLVKIDVDRLASKFAFSDPSSVEILPSGATGSVTGVALTARNIATHPYTMIATDKLATSGDNKKIVYRTDHNMTVGHDCTTKQQFIDALEANFYWLKNNDAVSNNALDNSSSATPEYVLENTCSPSFSNSNNLTQAIVKAVYNPVLSDGTTLEAGTSWFKITIADGVGTKYLDFADVVALYKGTYPNTTSPIILGDDAKASMDAQLCKILGQEGKKWSDEGLAIGDLDRADFGGYKAATVENESDYVLQYYQKAVNYYSVFIAHDQNTDAAGDETGQDVGELGRWGMVRNNSYSLNITSITGEGLPYIPDPTDPEIVDPKNPDPEEPTPADKSMAHIEATISIRNWVTWTQDAVLGGM